MCGDLPFLIITVCNCEWSVCVQRVKDEHCSCTFTEYAIIWRFTKSPHVYIFWSTNRIWLIPIRAGKNEKISNMERQAPQNSLLAYNPQYPSIPAVILIANAIPRSEQFILYADKPAFRINCHITLYVSPKRLLTCSHLQRCFTHANKNWNHANISVVTNEASLSSRSQTLVSWALHSLPNYRSILKFL